MQEDTRVTIREERVRTRIGSVFISRDKSR